MAWRWVKHIKTNDADYYFAVPGGLVYTGPTGQTYIHSIYIGGLYGDTGTAYREGVAAIDFMTSQDEFSEANIDYKDGEGSGYTIFYGAEGSGARFYFNPDNYPAYFQRTYYTFKNLNPYPIVTAWTGGFPNGRQDYTVGAEGAFFCCAVNDETRELYFGLGTYGHYYYPSSPTYYYNGASIDISMLDFNSNANLYEAFVDYIVPEGGGSSPYVTDDYDDPVGGNDDPDDSSDTITEDALPTIGATVSGLCTAFVPTIAQMQALANRLVDPTWYQALGNTVLDISDAVIGLQVLPFVVPSTLSQNQWKLNFLGISLPSGVYLNKANQQFCEIPCGTLHVTPYWNNCLDYNPYTQISVFLPFCGFFELDTDDVMDHDLEIKYRVDIMSGACLATIKVDGSVMYQFAGECGNQIPVSSVSFDNFLQSAMQLAITTASGSIGLAAAGASATMQKEKIAMSDMSAGDKQIAEDAVNADLKFKKSQNGVGLLAATAGAVISAKGQYKHAGCIAGSPGFLGVRKPYLIIKRPKQIMPSLYGDFRGYPTNTVMKLSDCHGYTEVDSIRLNIPNATVDEIYECETLLKEGVVFD